MISTSLRTLIGLLWASTLLVTSSLAQEAPASSEQPGSELPGSVEWSGSSGPGVGKHIVFIAGDHEYRGEESLPALARILAQRYGFRCTFIVTTNAKTGEIEPGSSHISGLEVLRKADLMVLFVRFQHFADTQMRHIDDYLETGRPVIGLRTSTHGFQGLEGEFARYNEGYAGEPDGSWRQGFGEEILGEHWVGHFGRNHVQSSRLILEESQLEHAILRGVRQPHVLTGGYVADPRQGSITLARGQVLDGMQADSPPTANKEQETRHPVAWVSNYRADEARSRVFATTHGGSEDLLNEDFRRLLINAHLWCLGMEAEIRADNPVDFVGPFHPATFGFGGYRRGVKPEDIAGFEAPIYDPSQPTSADEK